MDLREKLNDHRRHNFLCDVNLIVETSKFAAHKFVLAATSDYFSNMFVDAPSAESQLNGRDEDEQDLKTSDSPSEKETETRSAEKIISDVELKDVKANGFESILKFLYTSRFSCKADTVLDILHNARVLRITDVMQNCVVFLCQNLTAAQCIPIYHMALKYNYFSLICACKQFMLNRFPDVLINKSFFEMSPVLLCQLLSDDSLRICDEKLAMRSVVKWIMHDITSRKSFADRMLSSIRFSYINHSDFLTELDKCKDVAYLKERFEACQVFKSEKPLGTQMLLDVTGKESQKFPELVSMQHIPRKSYRPRVLLCGGVSEYRNSIVDWVDQYDLFAHSWSQCNRLTMSRSGHALVAFDKHVYIIGGQRSPDEILDNVDIFDPNTDQFKPTSRPLTPARKWFGVVQHGRNIYVIGGYSLNGPLSSIETFSPISSNSEWSNFVDLETPMFSFGWALVGQELYLAGGVVNNGNSDAVSVLCLKTRKQSSRSSMSVKRSQLCLVAIKDSLYAIGGRNCSDGVLNSVERYSIIEDSWTKVSPMLLARAGACAVAVDNLIYVFGGRAHLSAQSQDLSPVVDSDDLKHTHRSSANKQPVEFAEVYDPSTNQWNPLPGESCASRSYAAALLIQPLSQTL